jgi:hypothetical protein
LVWVAVLSGVAHGETLKFPPRPPGAESGTVLSLRLAPLTLPEREQRIAKEIISGNVPDSLRTLYPVSVTSELAEMTNQITFYATADYLAIGSTADYLLTPLSPQTAQRIADALGGVLPTSKMVDLIYQAAHTQLPPSPIPPSPAMTSLEVFSNHNAVIHQQLATTGDSSQSWGLIAGHKKDVVITPRLDQAPGKVAIYGWHQTNGIPIQPLYLGHANTWVDYSQCTRLISREVQLNGRSLDIAEILTNSTRSSLLSNEGPFRQVGYPTMLKVPSSNLPNPSTSNTSPESMTWKTDAHWQERVATLNLGDGVTVHLSLPLQLEPGPGQAAEVIIFTLPNGNTIEQTLGKKRPEPDASLTATPPGGPTTPYDWHFDIQHIAAQTRFLRATLPRRWLAVACLGNDLKSWPAWRKKFGDAATLAVLKKVQDLIPQRPMEVTLSSHSGGGSFIFGCLNASTQIPTDWVRIAFLDSNYAYDRALGHNEKLIHWLEAGPNRSLCVLAYNDAVALLDGKSFVSASGGTWGRSLAMQEDLAAHFPFEITTDAEFRRFSALSGRIQFILKENPERKIYHTVQVERNGFIHGFLSGTTNQNRGYTYFGQRAYSNYISN